ncbi:MAG: MlaD family protein [Solirubrobacteraceae bacterium]|nr:MlaD family protein [Solirubrobacteraceae bacterium]
MSRLPLRRSTASIVHGNFVWGALMAAAILLFVYWAFGGPLPGGKGREMTVITRDAGMLRPGKATKVRVAGVDIGYVRSIEPAEGQKGLSEIHVDLDDDAPTLRRDATVKIRPRLFLEGNFFLDVFPGTPGAPELGDAPIPPGASTIHVAFDEIFSALDSNGRSDFQETLRGFGEGLQNGGAEALNRLIRATPPVLGDAAVVSKALRGRRDGDLPALIRSTGRMMQTLQTHEDSLRGVLRDGRRTFQAFADRQGELRATIAGLDRLTGIAMPALGKLNAALPDARALVRDSRPLIRRLSGTLDVGNPALRALLSLARSKDLQGLIAELRPALRAVSESAEPLGEATGNLRPVAVCLWQNALPVLTSTVPDGALSTRMPVYQEFLSLLVGLNSAAQDFDGNGPWVRYGVGLGNQLLSIGGGSRDLAARATEPIVGSSPRPTNTPPFRGDVPCETQGVESLASRAVAYKGEQREAPVDRAALARAGRALRGPSGDGSELLRRLEGVLGSPSDDGATPAATGERGRAGAAAARGSDAAPATADDRSVAAGAAARGAGR